MDNLNNDSRNVTLSKSAILKSDKDIGTIKSLNEFAKETGNILVLSGGYATEAHCGGKITRAHGDIDAHLILTGSKTNDELFSDIHDLLSKEDTKWALREQQPEKVDYLENNEDKEFFDKRRVEVRLNLPHDANIKYPKKKLIDSQGNAVEVGVVDINQMISEKMTKMFETKENVDINKDRHSSKSDYMDLARLLEVQDFDKNVVLKSLSVEIYNTVINLLQNQ